MFGPPTDAIGNLNAILRSICGRTPTGESTACIHDHTGEASGIYNLVAISVLRQLGEDVGNELMSADEVHHRADEIQRGLTP